MYGLIGIRHRHHYALNSEIIGGYRKVSLIYHPDGNIKSRKADILERYKAIQGAYNVLKDQSKRKMYDNGFFSKYPMPKLRPASVLEFFNEHGCLFRIWSKFSTIRPVISF